MCLRLAALLFLAAAALAQKPASTAEIDTIVRAGLQARHSDGNIAKSLRGLKPSEFIDEELIETLESAGAGPKTVAELERLRVLSRGMPVPGLTPQLPDLPPPSVDEQRAVLAAAREAALSYHKSLPDFICTQLVRRYEDTTGTWELKDTLEVKLTYFEQRENYQLLKVNGRASTRDYRTVGGAVSEGEFGSLLLSVFDPQSQTDFRWERWSMLRGRPAHVFTFRIPLAHSSYRISFVSGLGANHFETATGQHGLVFIDQESRQAVRISGDADNIPADFPVRRASTVLDFATTTVGGRTSLLPLRAEVRMTTEGLQTRNLVEFRAYKKFTSEATITFH